MNKNYEHESRERERERELKALSKNACLINLQKVFALSFFIVAGFLLFFLFSATPGKLS